MEIEILAIRMKKTVILSSLALLVLIAVLAWSVFKPSQETIKIAIAAPLSNIGQTTAIGAESMVRGAQLYVDQINQAGGIEGKKLELEIYDDHNEANIAAEVAHKIVASDALAVIGHYSSKTSLVAGKIYQAYGIPAVTGSATTDDITKWNNWYFRTTISNSNQGLFIADYINKILKRSRITIIYSPDSYGLNLAEDVATGFSELGGEVVNRWSLETDVDRDRIVDDLVAIEENGQDPGVIFMAAGLEESANLIARIKLYELNYSIFGSDILADVSLAEKFANTPEERDDPGFFTNNIYALTPIVFDISGETGQQFRSLYEQRFGSVPGWIAAAYYDTAHVVASAIAESFNDESKLARRSLFI